MKLNSQSIYLESSLSDFAKSMNNLNKQIILFETKAYHEKNYSSYLMLESFFKIEILDSNFKFKIFDEFGKKLVLKFIKRFDLKILTSSNTGIEIDFKAKHLFASQEEMIKNHPYFDLIRQLIQFLKLELNLAVEFIFPMIFSYDLIDQFYDLESFDDKSVPDFQLFMPKQIFIEDQLKHKIQHYYFFESDYVKSNSFNDLEELFDKDENHVSSDLSDEDYSKYIAK